jgi:hypothetical protein
LRELGNGNKEEQFLGAVVCERTSRKWVKRYFWQ